MTEQEFRDRVVELVKDQPVKVWLTLASGHRLEFLWSVGPSRPSPSETLARNGQYYIVGQDVPETLKPVLLGLFDEFCRSGEARRAAASVRPLRFIRVR
ncbi:MAG: hypothetical protein KJ726_02055 [Verrucomicrobia bacterium]|nr:hypothetical protein [Verrucomicrobiota bacterium]MBU1908810.1 hypothetical protein [Verrucomicrobiota bacterium]